MFGSQLELEVWPVLRRHRLVFLHAGRLFDHEQVRADLESVVDTLGLSTQLVSLNAAGASSDGEGGLVVFHDLEFAANTAPNRKCQLLGRLREAVMSSLESDKAVLMLSRAPAVELLGCAGSSVILDSKRLFLRRLEASEYAETGGENDLAACEDSTGLPRILTQLRGLDADDGRETTKERSKRIRDELKSAVREGGFQFMAWLEHEVCRNGRWEVPGDNVAGLMVEAARGAGLATSDDDWSSARLFAGFRKEDARAAILGACIEATTPNETISRAFQCVWEIEREMRRFVQSIVSQSGSDLIRHIPIESSTRIIKRAQNDGYGAVHDVVNVPNPLDWLTMEELLEVIERVQNLSTTGYRFQFWRRLVSDVGPIRNRLAHMRLVLPRDLETVESWRARIRSTT